MICKIEGCSKVATARGWCRAHYWRWSQHGDPLGGGTVRGELERFFRDVALTDDRGPDDPCLIWPYGQNGEGYATMSRDGKMYLVSRLVCKEAHGEPPTPKHDAAHSCGSGHLRCVTKGHLSWKTRTGNKADELLHGTRNRGERHGNSQITEATARTILALKGKKMQKEIAADFGVAFQMVSSIHRRQTWAWL